MLMSVQRVVMDVVRMPIVIILVVATGVSAGQDSREMDTTVQVYLLARLPSFYHLLVYEWCNYVHFY